MFFLGGLSSRLSASSWVVPPSAWHRRVRMTCQLVYWDSSSVLLRLHWGCCLSFFLAASRFLMSLYVAVEIHGCLCFLTFFTSLAVESSMLWTSVCRISIVCFRRDFPCSGLQIDYSPRLRNLFEVLSFWRCWCNRIWWRASPSWLSERLMLIVALTIRWSEPSSIVL